MMISQNENINGDKIKALALAKECYAMKLELLTRATVVEDAIRFVALHAVKIAEKDTSDKEDIVLTMITINAVTVGIIVQCEGEVVILVNRILIQ
jgi:hypothetical protein